MIRSPLVVLLCAFGVGAIAGAAAGGLIVAAWFRVAEPPRLDVEAPEAAAPAVPLAFVPPPAAPPPLAAEAPTVDASPTPELLLIATGSVTGGYFPTGGAICRVASARRQDGDPYCAALSTDGSQDNLAALRAGRVPLAVVQSDWLFHAYRGTLEFAEAGADPNLRAVMSLYKEPFTFLVHAEGVGIADLRGKRIGIGAAGTGRRAALQGLLRALGWDSEDLASVSDLEDAAQRAAFCAGELDMIAFATGHPNDAVAETIAGCGGVLMGLSEQEAARLIQENPFYARAVIPGGVYAGHARPTASIGVAAALVASAEVPAEAVHTLVSAIFDGLAAMTLMHPALGALNAEEMVRDGLSVPLHDGAQQYYEERGWM